MKHGVRSTRTGQCSYSGAAVVIALLACCIAWQPAAAQNVVGWGRNFYGECSPPADLTDAVAVSAGGEYTNEFYEHGLALRSNGTVAAWGSNAYGQCDVPAGLSGVVAVSAGAKHSLALKSDGTIVAWGDNSAGQLNVPALPPGVTYTAISAGYAHNMALRSDGTAVGWGWPNNCCNVPPLDPGETYVAVAASSVSAALKSDGTVVAWGSSYMFPDPTPPADLTGVTAIALGWWNGLALKADGTVVAWGANIHGQLEVPDGLSDVVAVAAGGFHCMALKSDGTVVCWGGGLWGQTTPPAGLDNVTAIAAGAGFSLACTDAAPPVIQSIVAAPNILWSPNHRMEDVTVTVVVTDNADPAPTCQIVDVLCNEPANDRGDGNKEPDWEITGDLSVKLRAERSGRGGDRVYTIIVEATDASGNVTTAEVDVTVPHDKRK